MAPPRPMKPTKLRLDSELDSVSYPVICQPKLNGVRCIVNDGQCYSNSGKAFPSAFVQRFACLENFDGELICGSPTDNDVLRKTTSAVMTNGGIVPVTYYVFDYIVKNMGTINRLQLLKSTYDGCSDYVKQHVMLVESGMAWKKEDILLFEEKLLSQGHEGVILRSPNGTYKHGRSTVNEQYLLALKRRMTGTAVITAVNELQENYNESKPNELGFAKKSHLAENRYAAGMLGSLTVVDCTPGGKYNGVEFNVGTGFDEMTRCELWSRRSRIVGAKVAYSFFGVGVFNKPLHAAYRGLV